jgi:FAD/FMN-containing dehydrogenase
MISRREFLKRTAEAGLYSTALGRLAFGDDPVFVNDIHSQLNRTRVSEVLQPTSTEEVQKIVRRARKDRKAISIAGGRHAMGGQQFGTDTVLIDARKLNRILHLDANRGLLEVEGGIEWPQLINGYIGLQQGNGTRGASRKSRLEPTESRWAAQWRRTATDVD